MPRYDSFLSLQSTPWFEAQFDLTLAALGKKRKKAARGVRFESGLGELYLRRLSKDFKLVVSYLENFVSVTTSEPMTFFNISSPGDLRRRFAKFIANISQRHNDYVSLSML